MSQDRTNAVSIDDVRFRYRLPGATTHLDVLDRVTVHVARGERVAIVGPSGCGKSTLLRLVLGLEQLGDSCGAIVMGRALKGRIGYVAQEPTLYPWRTVLQNAVVALEATESLSREKVILATELLFQYGLKGFEHFLPDRISGGMKQRVAIVRAIAALPKLLVCDEPFANIDYITRLRLCAQFRQTCISNGTALLLVTHNIEEAIYLTDRIIVLSDRPAEVVGTVDIAPLRKARVSFVEMQSQAAYPILLARVWEMLEMGRDVRPRRRT